MVNQEIRYHFSEAGEVFLVWGINGWAEVPQEIRPAGTIVKKTLMHTPMIHEGENFTIKLQVPLGATVDYGFLITRTSEGNDIKGVWEGAQDPLIASQDKVIDIQAKRTLPRGQLAALIFDFKTRWLAILLLLGGFGLVFGAIAISQTRFKPPTLRYLDYLNSDLVKLVVFALASKLLLLLIAYLSYASYPNPNDLYIEFDQTYWDQTIASFSRGDAQWYLGIAQNGYENKPFSTDQQTNWAFYPLFPIALKLGSFLMSDMVIMGLILSNLFFLLALIFLYKLIALDFDEPIAWLTVLLLIISPGSYFFSRIGPEALFLLLVVTSLYAARMRCWVFAGILGSLAVLTRLQGVLLLFPLLYIYYKQYILIKTHDIKILTLFLLPIALLLFFGHLYWLTGNMLASFDIQETWDQRLSYPLAAMVEFVSQPRIIDYYGWNLTLVNFIFVFCSVVLTVLMIKRTEIPREYILYTALNLYLVVARDTLQASLRFLTLIFPLFLILAVLISQKRLIYNLVFFVFVTLQLFYFVSFVQQYNWAGT